MSRPVSCALSPQFAARIMIGALLAANIAGMRCDPKGIALATGALPFRSYNNSSGDDFQP